MFLEMQWNPDKQLQVSSSSRADNTNTSLSHILITVEYVAYIQGKGSIQRVGICKRNHKKGMRL